MNPAGALPARRGASAWAALGALAAYAALVHHAVGPRPRSGPLSWYTPRGWAFGWGLLDPLLETPALAIAALSLPALALAAWIAVAARSAVATALGASGAACVLLLLYYGLEFPFAWEFFVWRGSAVMGLVALCAGCALAAPRLAASWLRLHPPARLALYLPVCLAVLLFVGSATGTDAALRYSISPWPAVPVFGLEVAAAVVAAWWAGMAAGAALAARLRPLAGAAAAALASALCGAALPAAAVSLAAAAQVFPFSVRPALLAALAAVGALGAAAIAALGRGDRLRARSRRLGLGAALVALPLAAALAVERFEYHRTRDVLAQRIIDALALYYEGEAIYPESLDALVARGLLSAIPEPEIGAPGLVDDTFRYQDFGTSYLLEFSAPRWVQCAYSPPWHDEDLGEDEEPADAEDGSVAGAWSCPSEPPELW